MNLINYLGDPDNTIECSDIGLFIDSLVPWMQSSNNKVCAFSCIFVSSSWFILFDSKYSFIVLSFFPKPEHLSAAAGLYVVVYIF